MSNKSQTSGSQIEGGKSDDECPCADPAASSDSEQSNEKELQKKMEDDVEQENTGAEAG